MLGWLAPTCRIGGVGGSEVGKKNRSSRFRGQCRRVAHAVTVPLLRASNSLGKDGNARSRGTGGRAVQRGGGARPAWRAAPGCDVHGMSSRSAGLKLRQLQSSGRRCGSHGSWGQVLVDGAPPAPNPALRLTQVELRRAEAHHGAVQELWRARGARHRAPRTTKPQPPRRCHHHLRRRATRELGSATHGSAGRWGAGGDAGASWGASRARGASRGAAQWAPEQNARRRRTSFLPGRRQQVRRVALRPRPRPKPWRRSHSSTA